MAELIMPKMGDAMTEGKVIRWYKKPGDAVKKDEPVLEIETDKVNLDLEAETDGTLGAQLASEGQTVPVGGLLAKILGPGEKEEAQPAPEPQRRQSSTRRASTPRRSKRRDRELTARPRHRRERTSSPCRRTPADVAAPRRWRGRWRAKWA